MVGVCNFKREGDYELLLCYSILHKEKQRTASSILKLVLKSYNEDT